MLTQAQISGTSFDAGEVVPSTTNPKDKAFQFRILQKDGTTKISTLIPFHISADGTWINSFSYFENIPSATMKNMLSNSITVPVNFTDLTITTITYEDSLVSQYTIFFYRHLTEETKWNSPYVSTNVQSLWVLYRTVGRLYAYPDCMNSDNPTCIQDPYEIDSQITRLYPTVNTIYGDYSHSMPYNRVVRIDRYFQDTDYVYVEACYRDHNNVYHDYDSSFSLY